MRPPAELAAGCTPAPLHLRTLSLPYDRRSDPMSSVTPDRWRALSPYLDEALDLERDARAAWLASLAARDPTLAADLRLLLDDHEAANDAGFLERAWSGVTRAAARAKAAVILGTERVVKGRLHATALVVGSDGAVLGFQDKVQLDPSEEGLYWPGWERRVFESGPLTFGIAICHEGWRYPETVRWAARRGSQVVLHPHFHEAEPGGFEPKTFADPRNTFHEKALLCRAAENTCYVASVNCASPGSPTTSAFVSPEGTLKVGPRSAVLALAAAGRRSGHSPGPADLEAPGWGSGCRRSRPGRRKATWKLG